MRSSKGKALSSLLSTAMEMGPKPKTLEPVPEEGRASSTLTTLVDSALNLFVSPIDPNPAVEEPSTTSEVSTTTTTTKKKKNKKKKNKTKSPGTVSLADVAFPEVKPKASSDSEELTSNVGSNLTKRISSILIDDTLENGSGEESEERRRELDIPWMPSLSHNIVSLRRKDVIRDRKLTWVFSSSQSCRFNRLASMCTDKVGSDTSFDLFGKLGRGTGLKEYNAFLNVCIETARQGNTEDVILQEIHKAFQIFKSMKENGFQLEEQTYGPFLSYLIEMEMIQEFSYFCDIIEGANPSAAPKLGYYEMLLCIQLDADDKILELCQRIEDGDCEQSLIENYFLALCERGRDNEFLHLLKSVDVTKFSSTNSLAAIFNLLGKLQGEAIANHFLLALKARDFKSDDLSHFIYSYAVGDPNLGVEDVIQKFKNLHAKMEVKYSSAVYNKLIKYGCDLQEVGRVLNLFDEIFEEGMTVSIQTINYVLRYCEATYNFNLVYKIYSLICDYDLPANAETFRLMITLSVKMRDMETAKSMLKNMEELKLAPTSNIYNIVMSGCLRENNWSGAEMILNSMGDADVNPDSTTFAQIIKTCSSEKDIDNYWELLKNSGVHATKNVFMALINAYTTCGLFEKAKNVIHDKSIPVKNLHEIKSALVQALATRGQLSDALQIYDEIKQSGFSLEPKAAISIIENYALDGGFSTLLKVLEELTDPVYWLDGCSRVINYCVRRKDLSPSIDLLKKLKDKLGVSDELVLEAILDEAFCLIGDLGGSHLQTGLELLRVVKVDLGLKPPRKCLDFLLHACVAARDLENSRLIWKEYDAAGLPHNIISYLRMYQALLVSGDHKAAKILLTKIPKDDMHVQYIMKACQVIYGQTTTVLVNTKNKKKLKQTLVEEF